MNFDWVKNLPDHLESQELKRYLFKIVIEGNVDSILDKEYVAQALWELSERQWHTYETIDYETKEKLNAWIKSHFSGVYSKRFVELIGGVIGMLGLQDSYEYFKEVYNSTILPDHIKHEFENIFVEYGGDVSDPYRDLR